MMLPKPSLFGCQSMDHDREASSIPAKFLDPIPTNRLPAIAEYLTAQETVVCDEDRSRPSWIRETPNPFL